MNRMDRARITFDYDISKKRELMKYCKHGVLTVVMSKMTDDLLDALKQSSGKVLGGILSDDIKLGDFSMIAERPERKRSG